MDDNKIIDLFYERSEQAISQLAKKYGTLCNRIAFNILKDESDAEECVNDAYLIIWNTVPPEKPDPLRTYVCRIVRNTSINRYVHNTAKKRNEYYDTALEDFENYFTDPDGVEDIVAAKQFRAEVEQYLMKNDKESRFIFLRRYWYCDEIGDIAKMLHKKENYVSVKLFRIKEDLKNYLIKKGFSL